MLTTRPYHCHLKSLCFFLSHLNSVLTNVCRNTRNITDTRREFNDQWWLEVLSSCRMHGWNPSSKMFRQKNTSAAIGWVGLGWVATIYHVPSSASYTQIWYWSHCRQFVYSVIGGGTRSRFVPVPFSSLLVVALTPPFTFTVATGSFNGCPCSNIPHPMNQCSNHVFGDSPYFKTYYNWRRLSRVYCVNAHEKVTVPEIKGISSYMGCASAMDESEQATWGHFYSLAGRWNSASQCHSKKDRLHWVPDLARVLGRNEKGCRQYFRRFEAMSFTGSYTTSSEYAQSRWRLATLHSEWIR